MTTRVVAMWPEDDNLRHAIRRDLRLRDCDYLVQEGKRWAYVVTPADRHGGSTPPTPIRTGLRRWISIKPPTPGGNGPKGVA